MTFFSENQNSKTYTRFAFLLIVIGLLLSIDSFLGMPIVYKFWPLIIAVLAVGFLGIFIRRNRREPVFLSTSVYLICFTGLALYCNFTSWSNLRQVWPLFITFLGIVFLSIFLFYKRKYLFLLLGLLLLSLSAVFFLVFSLGGQYWWTVFILVGLSILIAEKRRWKKSR
jgi:hypothetical protein